LEKNNKKIFFIVSFSLLLSFLTIYYIAESDTANKNVTNISIKAKDPDKSRVFIIGSSHVRMLNSTYIDEYVSNSGKQVDVYNLRKNNDYPSKRFDDIQAIISTNPDLVIYGIDFYNFQDTQSNYSYLNNNLDFNCLQKFPSPQDYVELISYDNNLFGMNLDNFQNPKLSTLSFVSNVLSKKSTEDEKTWKITKIDNSNLKQRLQKISPDIEIQKQVSAEPEKYKKPILVNGKEVRYLKEMIKLLLDNGIHVVIFSTPEHEAVLNESTCNVEAMNNILQDLENTFNINTYVLHDKYSGLPIWRDASHITSHKNGMIYDDDIAEIISKEV